MLAKNKNVGKRLSIKFSKEKEKMDGMFNNVQVHKESLSGFRTSHPERVLNTGCWSVGWSRGGLVGVLTRGGVMAGGRTGDREGVWG